MMVSLGSRTHLLALALLLRSAVSVDSPHALSITPSTSWYGYDGTWSAIKIRVGTPPQWVDVMVSTVSSETWVVGPNGCDNNSLCSTQRGALFNPSASSTWEEQGFYYLDVDSQLQPDNANPYAQYGLDDLTFGTTGVTISDSIIGTINTTAYWTGMFGLGTIQGNFTTVTPLSAISALVETQGVIPSHSYGFTAGANYQQKGEVLSLTLGGYDTNRFEPHNVTFQLNPSANPQVYINSVYIYSTSSTNNWTTPIGVVNTADRVSAIIDSTTPYLWFPQTVCDRFAESLGLTYNESLNIYTYDGNPAQHDLLRSIDLTFTFTLSDSQFAEDSTNVVVPYDAFDLQFTYPGIPDTSYGDPNSTAYYFPLKVASNEAQYTIGRAFLQEAYLITDYERSTFSVHQAVHIADAIHNTSIVSIPRYENTQYSGPPSAISSSKELSTGAIVGIVVGVAIAVALFAFAAFTLWRRRRGQSSERGSEVSSEKPQPRRTFLARFRRQAKPQFYEVTGSTTYPTEVSADATHERFELPAPLGPAELDSDSGTLYGSTVHGSSTQDTSDLSAYERARRKLERQQNPASPRSATTNESYPIEKSDHDHLPIAHYQPEHTIPDIETPLVSPVLGSVSAGSTCMSNSNTPSPVSPAFPHRTDSPLSPPPTYRRVEPGNVIYAGRLPDNVQLPHTVPRIIGPDGYTLPAEQTLASEPSTYLTTSTGSLGSMYTENQNTFNSHEDLYGSGSERGASAVEVGEARARREEDESKFLREDIQAMRAGIQTREILDTVRANARPMDGEDLVHVPQPAERRFSFEVERLDGTD